MRARVTALSIERDSSWTTVKVSLKRLAVLRGGCAETLELTHSYSMLLERKMPDGSVKRVSPLRDGSGLETDLRVGEEYFFILDDSTDAFLRAEPLKSESEIRANL